MYRGRTTCAFLIALSWLALLQGPYAVADNRAFSISASIAVEQTTELEAKAMQLLYVEGDYDKALAIYQDILKLRARALGPDDVAVSPTWMNIALCFRAKGEFTKAEEAYKRALDLREKVLGQTHSDVVKTLKRYACLMRLAGSKEKADDLDMRAILSPSPRAGKVTGTVVNGTRVSVPQPSYPKYPRKQRLEGSVVVSIVIAEDGTVIEACAVDGPPSLALASEGAALRALFTPTTLDGVPVKVSGIINYNFVAR